MKPRDDEIFFSTDDRGEKEYVVDGDALLDNPTVKARAVSL